MGNKRIGDYAVELGFCSREEVDRAVGIQRDLEERGHAHMLIGLVMVRYGIITTGQLLDILRTLEQQQVEYILSG